MAKRFTDTEKWKKPFLRNLKAPYKLLWFYILDECDHSGIWQVDFDVARLKIGEKLTEADAIKFFAEKICVLPGGEKWFIPSFIEFQYGKLAENNRAHTKAISALMKLNLLDENLEVKPLTSKTPKPLTSSLLGAKEEVEVEDKEGEEEKAEEEEKGGENLVLVLPWTSPEFLVSWQVWKEYKSKVKKFNYASIRTEQAALKTLASLSEGIESKAIELIEYAIGRQWEGFYPIKSTPNGQQNSNKPATGSAVNSSSAFAKIAAMHSHVGNER